eukprot:4456249-Amphidinium_carterae.1
MVMDLPQYSTVPRCCREFLPSAIGEDRLEVLDASPVGGRAPNDAVHTRAQQTLQLVIGMPQQQHAIQRMSFSTDGFQLVASLLVEGSSMQVRLPGRRLMTAPNSSHMKTLALQFTCNHVEVSSQDGAAVRAISDAEPCKNAT